jgi:hypothetical protein
MATTPVTATALSTRSPTSSSTIRAEAHIASGAMVSLTDRHLRSTGLSAGRRVDVSLLRCAGHKSNCLQPDELA